VTGCFDDLLACRSLAEIAPRLARARDQLVAERRLDGRRRLHVRRLLLDAERLVAHRELQLIRAGRTRDPGYIARRQRKLEAARKALKRLQAVAS
jgi:hypothetical protein